MQRCMPFSQVPSRACRVWESGLIHDLEVGGWGGASVCRVLMHVSVNFIFIWPTEWDLECSSINILFSAKKLMAAA